MARDVARRLLERGLGVGAHGGVGLGAGLQGPHDVGKNLVDAVLVGVARGRHEGLEGLGVAHVGGGTQLVDEGEGRGQLRVRDQGSRVRVGGGRQHEGLASRPARGHAVRRQGDAGEQQAGEAGTVLAVRLGGTGHDAHARSRGRGAALGDQRGESPQRHRARGLGDRARQRRHLRDVVRVERRVRRGGRGLGILRSVRAPGCGLRAPLGGGGVGGGILPTVRGGLPRGPALALVPAHLLLAGLLEGRAHGRAHRLVRVAGEGSLQVGQVLARAQLLARRVGDDEGHAQVIGQVGARVRQVRLAEVHAAQDAHRVGEGVQDGALGEGAGLGGLGGRFGALGGLGLVRRLLLRGLLGCLRGRIARRQLARGRAPRGQAAHRGVQAQRVRLVGLGVLGLVGRLVR